MPVLAAHLFAPRSEDWHYAHLFAPRSVVPGSVMPAYNTLFDGAPTRPLQGARDLVAYLETLGRARVFAWPEGEQKAQAAPMDAHMAHLAFSAPELNAHPAAPRRAVAVPALGSSAPAANARALWRDNCASCHGEEGRGDGPAAAWLRPAPANLAEHSYTRDYILQVLWNGVAGTAMPAWRDQKPEQLAAFVALVQGFATERTPPEVAGTTLELGASTYARHCTQCHGSDGKGQGFAAGEFRVAAANFSVRRPSLQQGLAVLRSGIPGTAMAPWTARLNTQEQEAVVLYLRTLYVDDATTAEMANVD